MLWFLDKSETEKKAKPLVGQKKVVKKPGSKGGKGYFDNLGVWHYGKKPIPKVAKIAESDQEIEENPTAEDVSSPSVTVAPQLPPLHVGGVYYSTITHMFYKLNYFNGNQLACSIVTDEHASKTLTEFILLDRATAQKNYEDGQVSLVGSVLSEQAEAEIGGNSVVIVPRMVKEGDISPGAEIVSQSSKFFTRHYHILSVEDDMAKFSISNVSTAGVESDKYEQEASLSGLLALFTGDDFRLVAVAPSRAKDEAKPDTKEVSFNLKGSPKAGDVFYQADADLYFHIFKVNPSGHSGAVLFASSPEFKVGETDEKYNAHWLSESDWNTTFEDTNGKDGLKKVTAPVPIKNDLTTVKEGDIFYDKQAQSYMYVSSIDPATGKIEFYDSSTEDVSASGYLMTMDKERWIEDRRHIDFVKHVDQSSIPSIAYAVGDAIRFGKDTDEDRVERIFYADENRVYTTYDDNNSEGEERFNSYSRSDLNRKIDAGIYDHSPKEDKPTPLVTPPPIVEAQELNYRLPALHDHLQGAWDNDMTSDRTWVVSAIKDGKITFHDESSYYTPREDFSLTIDDFKAAGGSYFAHPEKESPKGFQPPMPDPKDVDRDTKSENAKMRVCAGLFNRLATDPGFFAFSQATYPELTGNDRNSAGLPYKEPDDENDVVRQQAKVYLTVRRLVHLWAVTSADTQAKAQCMQRAVVDEFGVAGAWDALASAAPNRLSFDADTGKKVFKALVDDEYARNGASYRKFIRAQYDETQKFFASRKMKQVTLYRGVLNSSKYVEFPDGAETVEAKVVLQPQSSFTTHPKKAMEFAQSSYSGVVFKTTLPVTRCISTALTGVGCLEEHEVTIMGGPPETMTAYSRQRYIDDTAGIGSAGTKIWKSRTYPLDARQREANWLRPVRPVYPIDADIREADWPKRTPNIPHGELHRVLKKFGISRSHFKKLPSGRAFNRQGALHIVTKSVPSRLLVLAQRGYVSNTQRVTT